MKTAKDFLFKVKKTIVTCKPEPSDLKFETNAAPEYLKILF